MADQALFGTTPESLKQRRLIAAALLKSGSETTPIQSPWQGAARLAQSLSGGFMQGMTDVQEKQGNAKFYADVLDAKQSNDPAKMAAVLSDPRATSALGTFLQASSEPKILGEAGTPQGHAPIVQQGYGGTPGMALPPDSGGGGGQSGMPQTGAPAPPPAPPAIPQSSGDVALPVQPGEHSAFGGPGTHIIGVSSAPAPPQPKPFAGTPLAPLGGIVAAGNQNELQQKGATSKIDQANYETNKVIDQLHTYKEEGGKTGAALALLKQLHELNPHVGSGFGSQLQALALEHGVPIGKSAPELEKFKLLAKSLIPREGTALANRLNPTIVRAVDTIGTTPDPEARETVISHMAAQHDWMKRAGEIAGNEKRDPHERLKAINALELRNPFGSEEAPAAAPGQHGAPTQAGMGGGGASIPASAQMHLRSNPQLRDQFEAKYGKGSAATVLGQ